MNDMDHYAIIVEFINKLPLDERRRLKGIEFYFDPFTIKIEEGGGFVKATYLPGVITFYARLINTKEDLKHTFIHELCHHFGMNEKQVNVFLKE